MIGVQVVDHHHFGLRIAPILFLNLRTARMTIAETSGYSLHIHWRNTGSPPIHQLYQPGILMIVSNWLILLRFQRPTIFQRFRFRTFIGCVVQPVHFIPPKLFTFGWLAFVESEEQLVKVKFTLLKCVKNRAEFPPKRSFFTQFYRRANMTGYSQCIQQIKKGICTFEKTFVYCFAELLD